MMTVIQNMDGITMFWVINVSSLNGVLTNQIIFLILVQLREISSLFNGKPYRMDNMDQGVSSELGYSNNMTNLLIKNKENLVT